MMKRVLTSFLFLFIISPVTASALDVPGWSFANEISSNDFKVTHVGANRVSIEYTGTEEKIDESAREASILIPLPQTGIPTIEVKSAAYEMWKKDELLESGTIRAATANRELNPLLNIKPIGTVRHWRLGTVSLKPYRLDYEGKFQTNRLYRSVGFDIVYPENLSASVVQDPQFLSSLRKLPVLDQLPLERMAAVKTHTPDSSLWEGSLDESPHESGLKISVEEEGLVFVPDTAGVVEDGFRLTHQALDVDFFRTDIPSEGIIFYGEKSDSPFSRESVYWLTRHEPAGETRNLQWFDVPAELQTSPGAPSTVPMVAHHEEDKVFAQNGARDEMQTKYWYWSVIDGATKESFSLSFPEIVSETFSLTISLGKDCSASNINFKEPDWEKLSLWLNGQPYDLTQSASRSLGEGYEITIEAKTEDFLSDKGESLTLDIFLDAIDNMGSTERISSAYLDFIDVCYSTHLVFDGHALDFKGSPVVEEKLREVPGGSTEWGYCIVSASAEDEIVALQRDGEGILLPLLPYFEDGLLNVPVRTAPSSSTEEYTILVYSSSALAQPKEVEQREPAGLRRTDNRADYLLITHRKFEDSASRLAAWHSSNGLKAKIINVEDIYREFGDGSLNPHFIKNFLTYAFRYWEKPAPAYVLLMGDASWDYWGRFEEPVPNYIPGYRVHRDYATDQWYISVEGDDYLPEYHLGRIPVQQESEAENVVNKILSYAKGEERGAWESRAMFFTDNEYVFESGLEEVIRDQVPPVYAKELIRLRDYEFMDNFYMPEILTIREKSKTSPNCTSHILEQLNEGCALLEFYGHGSPNVLCHERVFFGGGSKFSEVKKLTNGNKLPFVLLMTCDTGHFDYAQSKWNLCITEELLSFEGGGMLGGLASTGRGYPGHHSNFFRGFHQSLYQYDIRETGALCTAMELLFKIEETSDDPLLMFQIFGDPATALRVPQIAGAVNVVPDEIQARDGGRIVVFPEGGKQLSGTAFVSDGQGVLVSELSESDTARYRSSIGFDLPENLTVGTGYATIFSASVETGEDPLTLVGSYESLPREPFKEELSSATASPDLSVQSADITFSDFSPINGQTVFITVRVHNTGDRIAREVVVEAYNGEPGKGGVALTNMVDWPHDSIPYIRPGESEKITLRWDPFQQTGEHTIWVHVDPKNKIREESEKNNKAGRPLVIRKKADLEISGELKWDDVKNRYSLSYAIDNIGEETARDVLLQLRGFRSPDDQEPVEKDFDVIEEIAPGGKRTGGGIGVPEVFHSIQLMVDPDDIIDEETHENNLLEIVLSEPVSTGRQVAPPH